MRTIITPALTFCLTLAVASALLLPTAPAQGHAPADWYSQYRWPVGTSHQYGVQRNFPTGTARTLLRAAEADWNAHGTSRTPRFHHTLPDSDFPAYSGSACPNAHSTVFWQAPLTAGAIGSAQICVTSVTHQILRFAVTVKPGEPWYVGTGTPGAGQYDLQSTLAHELGHVTGGWGWGPGHFSDAATCPDTMAKQTMCVMNVRGTTWRRNIDTHDVHTFQQAYAGTRLPATTTMQAEAFDAQSGVLTQATGDSGGGDNIGWLADGDWARYDGVDFGGTGATQVLARVAAPAGATGQIEVRLDDIANAPVARVPITGTGGWQAWQTLSANVGTITGTHTVFLRFASAQPGHFVNVNWFRFAA